MQYLAKLELIVVFTVIGILTCGVLLDKYIEANRYPYVDRTKGVQVQCKRRTEQFQHISGLNTYTGTGSDQWRPKFTKGDIPELYLYGASILNSTQPFKATKIAMYGLWPKGVAQKHFNARKTKCCLKYQQDKIIESKIIRRIRRHYHSEEYYLPAFYFVCGLPEEADDVTCLPTHASIVFGEHECTDAGLSYIPTFYPKKSDNVTLGISGKVVYGNINSRHLIEWFEALRYLGVDKVLLYADDTLNHNASLVLKYYERAGLCEVIPFSLPDKDLYPRVFSKIDEQICNDFQIISWDSLERFRGYTYFGFLDTDEYLIPAGDRSFKKLMIDLDQQYNTPKRENAGYFFMTNTFITTWKRDTGRSDLEIGQHLKRFPEDPKIWEYHKKSLVVPEAVEVYMGGENLIMNDKFKHLTIKEVPFTEAYARHYRHCNNWITCNEHTAVTDDEMLRWAESTIATRVRKVRQEIFKI